MSARTRNPEETRQRLIQAAIKLILLQGFPATTVDEICAEAKLTKGSFFHHFANKDTLGMAVVDSWAATGEALYAPAWNDTAGDPLQALHRFFEIMASFTQGAEPCSCAVGMMSQEMALSHPAFREKCAQILGHWTDRTAVLLTAAKAKYAPAASFDPRQAAWFLNSIWQGSMLVAKTENDPRIIRQNLQFTREWIDYILLQHKTPN